MSLKLLMSVQTIPWASEFSVFLVSSFCLKQVDVKVEEDYCGGFGFEQGLMELMDC
ncbi:hypothetical protein RchiOBHm_Chr1g0319211 [Rosa chinensis]|uniref:Uncharacterized protein n=1 Tax=Rosa chinensis TaxID=74649 RepID=A0A2P6S8H0_ROSCH|nr:hypothetical protein RchiOBHm_Chr1g0319211 [Rosa chinensis]